MTDQSVLISGAGIAGPVLAHWLHRYGFHPTLVERAEQPRDDGYSVDVRGVATEVLRRTGVYETARARQSRSRHIRYVHPDGRPITQLDANLLMCFRKDDLGILRGDLTEILRTATEVPVRLGEEIEALSQGPDEVRVRLAGGAVETYDLVIGADGLGSPTRHLAVGEVPLTHLGGYISTFSAPNRWQLDHEELTSLLSGRAMCAYGADPDAPARVALAFASAPLVYDRRDVAGQKQLVKDAFAGSAWLAGIDDAPDFYFEAMSQVELSCWASGRVALVGDAAYSSAPFAGQGTSLALVGAYVLAGELSAAQGDHALAFARYESRMRPYVAKNLAFCRRVAREIVPTGRLRVARRNFGMHTMKCHPFKKKAFEQVMRPLHEAASAITLPEYDAPGY